MEHSSSFSHGQQEDWKKMYLILWDALCHSVDQLTQNEDPRFIKAGLIHAMRTAEEYYITHFSEEA